MDDYSTTQYRARLWELESQILRSQPSSRPDLKRLHAYCDRLVNEMSIELVNCRRLHKFTPKFQELEQKFNDSVDHLDQMIFFATLIED